jgi:hypothetical protein
VASIAEIREQIERVLALLDEVASLVDHAGRHLELALDLASAATVGSDAPDAAEFVQLYAAGCENCGHLLQLVEQAQAALRRYLVHLTGAEASSAPPSQPVARRQQPNPVHVRHAHVVRRVQHGIGRTARGAQTIGALVHPDGSTEDVCSVPDTPWYAETRRELLRLGGPAGRELARLATHIEVQTFLARLGRGEMTEATLVLSRRPCGTPPDPCSRSPARRSWRTWSGRPAGR